MIIASQYNGGGKRMKLDCRRGKIRLFLACPSLLYSLIILIVWPQNSTAFYWAQMNEWMEQHEQQMQNPRPNPPYLPPPFFSLLRKRASDSWRCTSLLEALQSSAPIQLAANQMLLNNRPMAISRDLAEDSEKKRMDGYVEDSANCKAVHLEEEARTGNSPGEVEVAPGMPLELRAICPFVFVDNMNEMRLPRTLTEVKCLCEVPRSNAIAELNANASAIIHCEPIQTTVDILLVDSNDCRHFKHAQQRLTIGCVAVYAPNSQSQFQSAIGQARQPEQIHI